MVNDCPDLRPASPVETISADRLGRKKFIANLAAAVRRYKGGKSLTIGLHGPWGSGKSSLLNFLIEELRTHDAGGASTLVVARFNPWNFSDQNRLLASFFLFFSDLLKKENRHKQLERAAEVVDGLAALTAPVGYGVSGALKIGANVIRGKVKELANVEHAKAVVSSALKAANTRYVIVIDDLDRLTEEEVRQVFQLVKAGADFDNVLYILAFDPEIVASALAKFSNGNGELYLEKIINVPFKIPAITQRQSRQLLFTELAAYSKRQREYQWDNERLREVVDTSAPYFTTIRLIEIFTNLLVMVEDLVNTDVDFSDHIGITMIQALEPSVHTFLAANPSLFVDVLQNQMGRGAANEAIDKSRIEAALDERLKRMAKDDILIVFQAIFPKVRRLFERGSSQWGQPEWRRQNRACADFETFARYFRFEVDELDVSSADLVALLASARDLVTFEEALRKAEAEERLVRILERLGDMTADEIDQQQCRIIVIALIDMADEFAPRTGLDDIFFGPSNKAVSTAIAILHTKSEEARFDIVMEALSKPPTSIIMPVEFVERVTKPASRNRDAAVFAESDVKLIRQRTAELIRERFEDGSIFGGKARSAYPFYAWLRLDPEGSREAVVRETASDDKKFLQVVVAFTNVTRDTSTVPMDLKALGNIYTSEELEQRLRQIIQQSSREDSEEAGRLLQLFEKVRDPAENDTVIDDEEG